MLQKFNNEFMIGSVSSIIASSLTYPIDLIKTNYQIANSQTYKPNTTEIIKNIYRTGGCPGFYKGVSSTLMTYPLFWGVFFQTKDYTNVMVASSVASFVTNPLFVLKTRFQTNSNMKYYHLIDDIYKKEGINGFYKGFRSTLANNTKLWIQFPLYDKIKMELDNNRHNIHNRHNNIVVASLLSKIISSSIYYPTDLIRTNQRNIKTNVSMFEVSKNIYKSNGVRGF